MSELEYAGIILEEQILDHLATPEGAKAIWKERFDPEKVTDDEGVQMALLFVAHYMDEYGDIPSVGVLVDEVGYDDFQEPVTPVGYIIDRIRERIIKKELKRSLTKVGRLAGSDPEEAVKSGFSEFSRIISETASRSNQLDTFDAGLVIERYKERRSVQDTGITFGFAEMDGELGGLRKGELYFVVGRPKRGKSWLLMKSAVETWLRGNDVDFFTLEMSPEEMQDRFLCMLTGVSWTKFQHKALMPDDIRVLEDAKHWLMDQQNHLRFIRPRMGERTVPHMQQIALEHQVPVVYIDQFSWVEPTRRSPEARWQEVGYICEELKEATAEFPIYIAAQFNREANRAKSVFDLDLANIGLGDAIGQMSDMILGIFANKEMLNQNTMQYGAIDSRSFKPVAWEVAVELGINSNFRVIDRFDLEGDE